MKQSEVAPRKRKPAKKQSESVGAIDKKKAKAEIKHYQTDAEHKLTTNAKWYLKWKNKAVPSPCTDEGYVARTSLGMRLSAEALHTAFKLIKTCRKHKKTYYGYSGSPVNIDGYKVKECKASGTLVVGCHTVTFKDAKYFVQNNKELFVDTLEVSEEDYQTFISL